MGMARSLGNNELRHIFANTLLNFILCFNNRK